MIQLFFKTSQITPKEWECAYAQIESIVTHFPLRLLRVENREPYSKQFNKDHFELRENIGTPQERISFYGDWDSYTFGNTITFYKNWEQYVANELKVKETDATKPITWLPHEPFLNDGSIPDANGATTQYPYIETRGSLYEYAIIAIGIVLENLLPDRFLMLIREQNPEHLEEIMDWLNVHFGETYDKPIHFDKKRLLASFINHYEDKSQAACRMEHLYRKQYKRNMIFALENIGYKPTFNFYAQVLSDSTFGTWGFSDVLDPWIAASQDLESTLALIAKSKELTLARGEKKEAEKYDLTVILKQLLKAFILWTPQQREELAHFYTNKETLETGQESLWGFLYRFSGYRVDICPMYSTQQELFEAFMYHAPKQGKIFKDIIDNWVVDNADAFDKMKEKLAEFEAKEDTETDDEENEETEELSLAAQTFINQYPKQDRFFIQLAVASNRNFADIETAITALQERVHKIFNAAEHQEHVEAIKNSSKTWQISYIRDRIKSVEMCVHPQFEQWLDNEEHSNVLNFLTLLMSIKLYDRPSQYARYRLLWDRQYWDIWRN